MLATNARSSAQLLLKWISDDKNSKKANEFATFLYTKLQGCFRHRSGCGLQRQHELLCEQLFRLQSSVDFQSYWSKFLNEANITVCPIFFQSITEWMKDEIVKDHFPLLLNESTPLPAPLDSVEKGVIRYMAGYVVHTLKKKMKRVSFPKKDEVIMCLGELEENGIAGDIAK